MSRFNIKVNDREITADSEKSLLDNLLENGVFVPNLCYDKRLDAFGGCGLCLVSLKGYPKPIRACSAKATPGMEIFTDTPEIIESRKMTLAMIHADHRGDCIAPCRRACPTNQDAQGYIALIADGKYEEAIRLIKADNPFPSSIGRVCPHPCEEACRRKYAEEAISICSLKRFAADIDNGEYKPIQKAQNGKKIAIVGAGPAGLTTAYYLSIEGYSTDVFESENRSGGMLRYGIPAYRLSDEILDRDISAIENLGVKIHYNKKLGRDISVKSLKSEYDAVFLAVGAWKSAALGCENDKMPGVLGGIDFLYKVAVGEPLEIGQKVAVVGGGNTAMDAARTARRLGAAEVTLIYRRTREEMPASLWEIEEAEEEGVKFAFLVSPVCVLEKDGRAAGLRLQKMELGEPDASGRRRPVPVAGAEEEIAFGTIIAAIGQKVLPEGLEGLEQTRWGTVLCDKNTFMTSIAGVFAGGDMINDGPDIAITAIAHGKHAAHSIDAYLKGEKYTSQNPFYVTKTPEISKDIGDVEKINRIKDSLLPPGERVKNFSEIGITFSEEEAKKEAERCLECGCSALYDCRLLPLLQNGFGKIPLDTGSLNYREDHSHPFIWRDQNKCILCGLCVRVCSEIAGKHIWGFRDRGFTTTVECAYNIPLLESDCMTCGLCSNACPTGALQDKRAFSKSPALPFKVSEINCSYCKKECKFDLYTYGKSIIKAVPQNEEKSCSFGRYGLSLKGNKALTALSAEAFTTLVISLKGDLAYFEGNEQYFKSPSELAGFFE